MSQMIQHYQTSFVIQNDTQTGENKLHYHPIENAG